MTPEDAAKVLLMASVYDNRTFDEVTARAWADALDGLELDDCLDAVKVHFRRSREWLMPVTVREIARDLIRQRNEQYGREQYEAHLRALEAAPKVEPDPEVAAARKAEIARLVEQVGRIPSEPSPHPKTDDELRRKARKHHCPWCKATVGAACTNTATGKPVTVIHEKRLIAAGLLSEAGAA